LQTIAKQSLLLGPSSLYRRPNELGFGGFSNKRLPWFVVDHGSGQEELAFRLPQHLLDTTTVDLLLQNIHVCYLRTHKA